MKETKAHVQATKDARTLVDELASILRGTVIASGGKRKYVTSKKTVEMTKNETRKGSMLHPKGYTVRVRENGETKIFQFDKLAYDEAKEKFNAYIDTDSEEISFPTEGGRRALIMSLDEHGYDSSKIMEKMKN